MPPVFENGGGRAGGGFSTLKCLDTKPMMHGYSIPLRMPTQLDLALHGSYPLRSLLFLPCKFGKRIEDWQNREREREIETRWYSPLRVYNFQFVLCLFYLLKKTLSLKKTTFCQKKCQLSRKAAISLAASGKTP